jgi:hypothetical protein
MSSQVSLRCRCGNLRGVASDVSVRSGLRVTCYCDDCQAYARFLGQPGVVDTWGGTDIFQMPQWRVRFTQGAAELQCVRLHEKGMFRFYAGCCRTPVANTMGPRIPFAGVVHSLMDHAVDGRSRDEVLGKTVRIQARFAVGGKPPNAPRSAEPGMILRALRLNVGWWLGRHGAESPFFDLATRTPRVQPQVLSERP